MHPCSDSATLSVCGQENDRFSLIAAHPLMALPKAIKTGEGENDLIVNTDEQHQNRQSITTPLTHLPSFPPKDTSQIVSQN